VIPIPESDLKHVFEKTRPQWNAVHNSSILITGGTGFFGIWLLESFLYINDFLRLGATAKIITRHPNIFKTKAPHIACRKEVKLIEGDVRNFRLQSDPIDYVIHAATAVNSALNPIEEKSVIVEGTRHVLNLAQSRRARRLLYVSSGAVYGPQPFDLEAVPEDYEKKTVSCKAQTAYGIGKQEAEHLCLQEWNKQRIDAVIARGFAFVGPHLPLDTHFAIGNFIRDALKGTPLIIHGNGATIRSYLYAADLAIWLWTILLSGKAGQAYNVGSSRPTSIHSLAETVNKVLSPKNQILVLNPNSTSSSRYVPDTSLAEKELGLKQHVELEDAVKRTADWHSAKTTSS
jgi:nucleoside-diphosphate-sugar epimerase